MALHSTSNTNPYLLRVIVSNFDLVRNKFLWLLLLLLQLIIDNVGKNFVLLINHDLKDVAKSE